MSSGFNRSHPVQQGNVNFPQQYNQYHRSNTADCKQHAYNALSVSSTVSNHTSVQQSNGSYDRSQVPQNTKPGYPIFSSPFHQANSTSTSQQENRNFQQQPQQPYQFSGGSQMTGNRQLPYNAPTINTWSNQEMKCMQSGERSGSTFNRPLLSSQHCTNLTQISVQPNTGLLNSNVSSQQQSTNSQQNTLCYPSNTVKHQISGMQQSYNPLGTSRLPPPLPNQQAHCQQIRHCGPNQTSQPSMFSQMPASTQYQPVQKPMLAPPISQTANHSNAVSNFNASDCQQQTYAHQHSAGTYQSTITQQASTLPCNIPPRLTNTQSIPTQHIQQNISVPPAPNQTSLNTSPAPNQTSQFPIFNQFPSNSQYQQAQRSAPITASQKCNQTSFISGPSSQQEKSFQQTQLCHQSSAIDQNPFNRQPFNQQINTDLKQQTQYHQPIPVGHPQQHPPSVTPGLVSGPSMVCNPYSQAQQNSKPPELNQFMQISTCNVSSTHHMPVVSSNSQVPVAVQPNLVVSSNSQVPVAVQPNLNTPVVYGPPPISSNSQVAAPVSVQSSLTTPVVYGLASDFTNSFPPAVPVQHFGSYQSLSEASSVVVKSQNELDSEWVSQWLEARKNRNAAAENKTSRIYKIPEVRKLLSQAFTFLKALAFVRDSLKSCRNESDETWDNKIKQAVNIKQRLEAIIHKLLKPETTLQLVKKLNRIKKKRDLHRRQREKRKMERLEQQKKRLEIHRLLDSYMETEKEKVLQAKREEELKKEADNILSEVRRKLQEGKRAQERLRAIEKLRQARKDTAQKRGLHISEETDNQFSKKMSLLNEIIHKQLQDYEAEEKALKVMLETEQEGQREQEETYRKERQKKLVNNMQKRIKECLFGDYEPLDASDPLRYYTDYYTQAERSLDSLVQIRHQWDIYLVRPTDACGSSIPVSWVTPEPPSSNAWASALDLK